MNEEIMSWEPEVQRIEPGVSAETFTVIVLLEIFEYDRVIYQMNDICEHILSLQEKGTWYEKREATEIEIKLNDTRRKLFGPDYEEA
jgi:hypothetical protein